MTAINAAVPTTGRAPHTSAADRHKSFLSDVVVEHGPRDVLGRIFLAADTHFREMGVRLSFGTLEDLIAVNKANAKNWSPLLPLFDPALNDLDQSNSFALLGRAANGEVVVTVASRLYELADATLAEEIESLRVFYRDPAKCALEGEAMRVSSQVARATRRRAVFSGAAWVHPDWRGFNLIDPAAPVVRGIGLTRWMPDLTFSFMVPELVRNGTAKRWFMNTDFEITMINTPVKRGGTIHAALSWTNPTLMEDHFRTYLASRSAARDAQVDNGVVDGAADEKLAGRGGR